MSASMEQIWNIVASRPKFVFSPTIVFLLSYFRALRHLHLLEYETITLLQIFATDTWPFLLTPQGKTP